MSTSRPPRFPARVLVVDDEPDLREAIVETLRLDGYIVDEAGNGAVALELALAHRPDVVIFDYSMPVTDGPTLVEELRTFLRPVPVLIGISAATRARDWCADHGVPIFVLKPFEDTTLRRAVDAAAAAVLESRKPKVATSSGMRAAARAACILAVGAPSDDAGLRESIPPALHHARVVIVESPEEAEHILALIVPDLMIVDDAPAFDGLAELATARGIAVQRRIPSVSCTMQIVPPSSSPPKAQKQG